MLLSTSYRDLLGTAESIIEMDGQMHQVEAFMGNIGQKCNTRLLEKKGANLERWSKEIAAPGRRQCLWLQYPLLTDGW